ncbi:MAG: relaxase, partial [Betaproteobacteria bacterium]
NHGHLAHAYTSTSFRAQGADADIAIASLSSQSLPAVTSRTIYVAASRGKKDVSLYCDDIGKVCRAIGRSGEEQSAIELVRTSSPTRSPDIAQSQRKRLEHRQRFTTRVRHWWHHHHGRRAELSETTARTFTPSLHQSSGLKKGL